jgi:hypothetical protein
MLNDKIKKKSIKKNTKDPNQPILACQTHDSSHEFWINS